MRLNNHQKELINYYDKLYEKHGYSVHSLGWSNESQIKRFEVLDSFIPKQISTLLDIGSGFGDFYKFLREIRSDLYYTGWEINPQFLKHCENVSDAIFEERDICVSPPNNKSFDVVVSIGSINTQCGDNELLAKTMLTEMFRASRIACFLSMTSVYVDNDYKQAHMMYYDPSEMFKYAMRLTKKVDLIHSYLPHDFTIILWQ